MSLRIIVLIDPKMCSDCRFNRTALVDMSDGTSKMMHRCLRRDCDNWQEENSPVKPVAVYVDGKKTA